MLGFLLICLQEGWLTGWIHFRVCELDPLRIINNVNLQRIVDSDPCAALLKFFEEGLLENNPLTDWRRIRKVTESEFSYDVVDQEIGNVSLLILDQCFQAVDVYGRGDELHTHKAADAFLVEL